MSTYVYGRYERDVERTPRRCPECGGLFLTRRPSVECFGPAPDPHAGTRMRPVHAEPGMANTVGLVVGGIGRQVVTTESGSEALPS